MEGIKGTVIVSNKNKGLLTVLVQLLQNQSLFSLLFFGFFCFRMALSHIDAVSDGNGLIVFGFSKNFFAVRYNDDVSVVGEYVGSLIDLLHYLSRSFGSP
jgi:hypothetical protein